MAVQPIPEGYHTITPYVICKGVSELLVFLKNAFDAQEMGKTQRPDGTISHADVRIGDSMIMLSEATGQYGPMPACFYMYVKDTDAVFKQAVEAGGEVLMEPMDQYYGDRNAGIKDASGNSWYIATHLQDVSGEELQRREEERSKANG